MVILLKDNSEYYQFTQGALSYSAWQNKWCIPNVFKIPKTLLQDFELIFE